MTHGVLVHCCSQKTHAYHRMEDSVPTEVKGRRLKEIVEMFYTTASRTSLRFVGSEQLVLVEKVGVEGE